MTGDAWLFTILGSLAVLLSTFGRGITAGTRALGILFGVLGLFMGLAHFFVAFGGSW